MPAVPRDVLGHALLLVWLLVAVLVAAEALGIGLMRDTDTPAPANPSFYVPLLCAGVAAAVAIFWHPRERAVWAALATGLTFAAAAESAIHLARQDGQATPTAAIVVYGLFCAACGATVLAVSGRFDLRRAITQGLGVCVFGLATAWSWLFFSGGGASGETVHSALDLLLAIAVLTAFCNHGWPLSPPFAMLAGGLGLVAVGDSMQAHGVLTAFAGSDLADVPPFAGSALIATAACYGVRSERPGTPSGRLVVTLSVIAAVIAVAAFVYDHYSRLNVGTILLAALTLLAASVRLLVAQRGWRDARAQARDAAVANAAVLDAALSLDPDGTVVTCNELAYRVFRRENCDIVGRPIAGLLGANGNGSSLEEILDAGEPQAPPAPLELCAYDPGGTAFPVEVTVGPAFDRGAMRTLVVRDISERKRREEENRRLAAIIRSSDDAVLTKDLSGVITGWNQGAERIYGYSAEEAIGRLVTELLIPPDRRGEARQILDQAAAGEVVAFETRRIAKGGALIDVSLRAFPIRGVSGEVTAVCTVGHDVSEVRRRERAEQRDTEALIWRRRLSRCLREGGLFFHGQPILDLRGGGIHHYELLVRMQLNGELIPPGRFLPFAEQGELIRELDLWAVERGTRLGERIPVAINLSARSLGSRELLGAIEQSLSRDSTLAKNLTFEITETAAAENMRGARELVGELTKMGCGVALDDFGTGYGSFTYLRHLPVTQLKIDMEFIRGIGDDAADRRVVESMIDVARNFEMTTVAEGVEAERTLELLRELDVDLAQGYLIGRPQPLGLGREADDE